jgi:hypothetical protein
VKLAANAPSSPAVVVATGAKPPPASASTVIGAPGPSALRPRTVNGRRGAAGASGRASSSSWTPTRPRMNGWSAQW